MIRLAVIMLLAAALVGATKANYNLGKDLGVILQARIMAQRDLDAQSSGVEQKIPIYRASLKSL